MSTDDLRRLRDLDDDLGAAFRSADFDGPGPEAKAALTAALGTAGIVTVKAATAVTTATAAKTTVGVTITPTAAGATAAKASASIIVAKWVVASAVLVGATASTYAVRRTPEPSTVSAPSASPTISPGPPARTAFPIESHAVSSEALRAPAASDTVPAPDIAAAPDTSVRASAVSSASGVSPASASGRASAVSSASGVSPASASVPILPARPTVADEISELDRARAELAANDPSTALASLDRYRTRFPHGVLEEESTILEIEALARAGRVDRARMLGAAFLDARPASPLASRVRRVVGAP